MTDADLEKAVAHTVLANAARLIELVGPGAAQFVLDAAAATLTAPTRETR